MSFTIQLRQRDSETAVMLTGELDMASAPRLQETVRRLVDDGSPRIVLDLYQLTFCDSAGLNAFVQGDKYCATRGGWLRLTRAQGHVARVVELSGVDDVLAYRRDRAT